MRPPRYHFIWYATFLPSFPTYTWLTHSPGLSEGAIAQLNTLPSFIRSIAASLYSWSVSTPATGAHASLFAATSSQVTQEPEKYKGAYLLPPCKITPLSTKLATSLELAADLWRLSEKVEQDSISEQAATT